MCGIVCVEGTGQEQIEKQSLGIVGLEIQAPVTASPFLTVTEM